MRRDYTLEGFISSNTGTDQISYSGLSIIDRIIDGDDTMDFTEVCLTDDYMDVLSDYIVEVPLTKAQQLKYNYNPGLLAYDVYGSVELEFLVLKLNGVIDPKDFDMRVVKLIPGSQVESLISDIRNAENRYIALRRQELEE